MEQMEKFLGLEILGERGEVRISEKRTVIIFLCGSAPRSRGLQGSSRRCLGRGIS